MSSTIQSQRLLPVLRDKHGRIIHEHDILRVFHFHGRRRGRGREKHYMYKIAAIKDTPRLGRQWWFHHTAELGAGLTNGYFPYSKTGDEWATDETLPDVEVIDSPATLHAQFCNGCRKCRMVQGSTACIQQKYLLVSLPRSQCELWFWGPDEKGYTRDASLAGRYDQATAHEIIQGTHAETIGILESDLSKLAVNHVVDLGWGNNRQIVKSLYTLALPLAAYTESQQSGSDHPSNSPK